MPGVFDVWELQEEQPCAGTSAADDCVADPERAQTLEQRTLPSIRRDPEMIVGELRRHAPAWSAVQKSNLH
jgi:hypothetical protein